jgi:hypothetical protein
LIIFQVFPPFVSIAVQKLRLSRRARLPRIHTPDFSRNGWPELNIDRSLVEVITAELLAFRSDARRGVGLHLSFNFNAEDYIRLA